MPGSVCAGPTSDASRDDSVLRPAADPFSATGGLKLLSGNLGRSVIKVSAVPRDHHVVEAPARVFASQGELLQAFQAGELERDVVCVVRWQGPRANGMPELHKLTPPLAVLQGKGHKVALVTDGRMSGASGKVPAAIHASPEAHAGGPLARVRDGDPIRLDAVAGTLDVLIDAAEWQARQPAAMPPGLHEDNAHGWGRELFVRVPAQCAQRGRGGMHMAVTSLTALQVMRDAPVIPGHRAARRALRRAAGARAGGRRHTHAGGHTAHPRGARLHARHRRRGVRGRGRRRHGAQPRRRRGRQPARARASPSAPASRPPWAAPAATRVYRCCRAPPPAARSWRRKRKAFPHSSSFPRCRRAAQPC
ncbi:phosphogluconate dehydratase [Alicycliphilus sp. B1]|nr:phosphogluconate dehydratase [Alicycliphilus sp. B1]